jgi:MFS family permease
MASDELRSVPRQRVVLAATIGNTLEWYDFLIYGFLAVTIAKLFFPTEDEFTSLLLSVGTFGAAAVVRPVAGVVLGIYADRVGRKAALTLTIFTMGLGTGLIVLAPNYASIGIWAPVLMVSARLLQGLACGGELGGATAILVENAPDHNRGLYASWQTASQAAGLLLGSVVTMLVSSSMTPAQLEAWGWRFGDLPCSVPLNSRDGAPRFDTPRPVLAIDKVRHVGQPVALVVAETFLQAQDAAGAVKIDYETLPAVTDARAALQKGAPLLPLAGRSDPISGARYGRREDLPKR